MMLSLPTAFHPGEPALLFRLVIAMLAGGAVGWNRFRAGKPAGTGTHALVAVGSAIFVAVTFISPAAHEGGMTRVIQGVVAGIGFLGAGEIFRNPGPGIQVKGLTSAAALWVTASLGILAVCGSMMLILGATALVMGILYLAPWLEHRFPTKRRVDPESGDVDPRDASLP
jgi:putative Mg2+ transporter-C (MgtC) family protein